MDAALVDALQSHLTMERQASAAYFAMAIWFAERELRGFSHFFKHEALSEQAHAATFADYLIARGQTVQLQELAAPRQAWTTPEDIMAGGNREPSSLVQISTVMGWRVLMFSVTRVSTVSRPVSTPKMTSKLPPFTTEST
jgi:hypothetical protein